MRVYICQIMQYIMLFLLSSQIRQLSPCTSCRGLCPACSWFCTFAGQCYLHMFHSLVPSVCSICNNLFMCVFTTKFCACSTICFWIPMCVLLLIFPLLPPSFSPLCISLFLYCTLPPFSLSYHLSVTFFQWEFEMAFLRIEQITCASGHEPKWLWTRRNQ